MDPKKLQYTANHEWCLVEENIVTIGLTEVLTRKLGEIVFVELPAVGDDVLNDEPFADIESDKLVHKVYSPADGVIAEINGRLSDDPTPVREEPYGKGWLVKVRIDDPEQLEELLTYDEYRETMKRR